MPLVVVDSGMLSKSFFAQLTPEQQKTLLEVSRRHLKELNELLFQIH